MTRFDLSKKALAYYPSNSELMTKFVSYISEFYDDGTGRELESD